MEATNGMGRTGMDWQGALALSLAAVGTAVSVYTAYTSWRDRRVRLAVRLAYGAGPDGEPAVVVIVANRGALAVTIEGVGLMAADGRRLAIGRMRSSLALGGVLRSREGASFWVGAREVEQALTAAGYAGVVELRVSAVDGVGGEHRSAPVPFITAAPRPHRVGGRTDGRRA
jgi:hypothetical protein